MTNGNTRTLLIKGNGMDMEYAMDDPHSPTDSSEDSVEVRVEAITNRHKRKLAEPRRFNSGPLKKRLCVRTTDHSSQPFRPWHEKENNNNNNNEKEEEDENGGSLIGAKEQVQFYKAVTKLDENKRAICIQPRVLDTSEHKKSEEEESRYFHPRLTLSQAEGINSTSSFQPAEDRLRSSEAYFQPPVVFMRNLEGEGLISLRSSVKAITSSEDEDSRGACFQPPVLAKKSLEDGEFRGACFQSPVLVRKSSEDRGFRGACFQPPVVVKRSFEDAEEAKGGYFQPPVVFTRCLEAEGACIQSPVLTERSLKDGESKPLMLSDRSLEEAESKPLLFSNRSVEDAELKPLVLFNRCFEDAGLKPLIFSNGSLADVGLKPVMFSNRSLEDEESKGSYIQPSAKLDAEEKEVLNHQAPLDLVKNQAGSIKTEPQSPRIPTHPKPEDSIEREEELISGTMLSFPKLNAQQRGNRKNFSPGVDSIDSNQERIYKNCSASVEDQNQEIIYKTFSVEDENQKTFKSEQEKTPYSVDDQGIFKGSSGEHRSYKSLSSAEQQNHQRNYKNMTRERRIEANARERTRVHTISAAFETLRKSVPAYSDKQKLSKLSVLRIACSYIATLENLLREDVDEELLEESVERVSGTIQREGKLRKKKDED